MKAFWTRLSERVDAMSLRERALIFACCIGVLLMVTWWLLTGPLVARDERITRELAAEREIISKLQDEARLLATKTGSDPNAALRRRIADLRRDISANDLTMRDRQARLIPPERMSALLSEILSHHRKLELVDLKSLAPALLGAGATPSSRDATPVPPTPLGPAVYRHGVELTVRGTYQEMVGYLGELEALPYQLYWSRLEVLTESYPTLTMKVTVHTLSLERTWLTV